MAVSERVTWTTLDYAAFKSDAPLKDIARRKGVSVNAVKCAKSRWRRTTGRTEPRTVRWGAHKHLLASSVPHEEVAEILGASVDAVRRARRRYGFPNAGAKARRWSDEDIERVLDVSVNLEETLFLMGATLTSAEMALARRDINLVEERMRRRCLGRF